jgi:hypothetical protein
LTIDHVSTTSLWKTITWWRPTDRRYETQIEDTNLLPHYRNNHNNHGFFWFWTSKTGPKPNRNRSNLDRLRFGLGSFF